MGEFNSDGHYIYYCGQESLRRNGVAIIVNKRVRNSVLGCSLQNDRMISVRFQGKSFNITVTQVYAPTSNVEEAEQFYEDLQDLLELIPQNNKKMSFLVLVCSEFPEIHQFLLDYTICWHVIHNSLLWVSISVVSCNVSFSFLILLIWVFFFSLVQLKVCQFLFFPKNHLLVPLILSVVFLITISLICLLIFIISFLLLTLGLICSSALNSLRYSVRWLIWDLI